MKEYVYHYTTLETLALILKNRKIRFNSLANVDDLEEQESYDLKDFGKFCYASCWTTDDKENIALWNMYSKKGLGVRIGMPKNWYELTNFEIPQSDGSIFNYSNYFGALTINSKRNQILFNITPMKELNEVEVVYTDTKELLRPKIYDVTDNKYTIKWELLGNFKSRIWKFQNEYRYSFCTFPTAVVLLGEQEKSVEEIGQFCKQIKPPFQFYDIGIKEEAFKEMRVLVGPSASEAEKIIVSSLLAAYNSEAEASYSSLNVRFK